VAFDRKAYNRAWHQRHPLTPEQKNARRIYLAAYYQKHKAKWKGQYGVVGVVYRQKHRERIRAANKRYRRTAQAKIAHRFAWILRKYGLTLDAYHALLERQGELCAICQRVLDPVGSDTTVDHDHDTGQIRGLLCGVCNRGLGMFSTTELLHRAGAYLERSVRVK